MLNRNLERFFNCESAFKHFKLGKGPVETFYTISNCENFAEVRLSFPALQHTAAVCVVVTCDISLCIWTRAVSAMSPQCSASPHISIARRECGDRCSCTLQSTAACPD